MSYFPFKNAFKKCFKIVFFRFGVVMTASRFLRAVAVFALFFGAGSHKSYWSGGIKATTMICQQIFSILALVIFLLKMFLKSVSKLFFSL